MAALVYQGELRRLTGKHEETVNVTSMYEVMQYIAKTYGENAFKHARRMLIALDGVKVENINNREQTISAGSEVYFFPISCGG